MQNYEPIQGPFPPTQVADKFLVTEKEVYLSLSSIKTTKAVGPDNIPKRLPRDFTDELNTGDYMDIYNQSLSESYIPRIYLNSQFSTLSQKSCKV
jgi:hypothetical protein